MRTWIIVTGCSFILLHRVPLFSMSPLISQQPVSETAMLRDPFALLLPVLASWQTTPPGMERYFLYSRCYTYQVFSVVCFYSVILYQTQKIVCQHLQNSNWVYNMSGNKKHAVQFSVQTYYFWTCIPPNTHLRNTGCEIRRIQAPMGLHIQRKTERHRWRICLFRAFKTATTFALKFTPSTARDTSTSVGYRNKNIRKIFESVAIRKHFQTSLEGLRTLTATVSGY